MKFLFISSIKIYQVVISPFFISLFPQAGCRFNPTCSEFAIKAVSRCGILKGSFLSIRRVFKCNPWSL